MGEAAGRGVRALRILVTAMAGVGGWARVEVGWGGLGKCDRVAGWLACGDDDA